MGCPDWEKCSIFKCHDRQQCCSILNKGICPKWEDCHKKGCIELDRCTNPDYWSSLSVHVSKKMAQRALKKEMKLYEAKHIPVCVKCGDWCDKKEACSILGQCIGTLSFVEENQSLLNALRGPHTSTQIIQILRKWHPAPMRSYYLGKYSTRLEPDGK